MDTKLSDGYGGWFDWAYKGVDHTLPGNGGLECRDYLSLSQRYWESIIAALVALTALMLAVPRLRLPTLSPQVHQKPEPVGKRVLLLLMCLTFGIELGFKLATRQMIWIGNPCHLATMIQIFILAAPPSRLVTAAFRLHIHMLTGAPIAILFPVINTRLLPFESSVYFIQHILMIIIPFYLMKTGDPFIPEELMDFSWPMVSFGFLFIYHFLPLQLLAYVSQVNLNNMLCPAVSDPFHGQYYRLTASAIQMFLIPCQGKVFVIMAKAFKWMPSDNRIQKPSEPATARMSVSSEYCVSPKTPCSSNSNVSMASSTKLMLDDYDDSGFLGAGCALGSKSAGSTSQSDDELSYSCLEDQDVGGHGACSNFVEDKTNQVVKRLVNNSCLMADGVVESSPTRKDSTGCKDKLVASPDVQNGVNGHVKLH